MDKNTILFVVPMEEKLINFIKEEMPLESDFILSTLTVMFTKNKEQNKEANDQKEIVLQKDNLHSILVPMLGSETGPFLEKMINFLENLRKTKKRVKKVSFIEIPEKINISSNEEFLKKRKMSETNEGDIQIKDKDKEEDKEEENVQDNVVFNDFRNIKDANNFNGVSNTNEVNNYNDVSNVKEEILETNGVSYADFCGLDEPIKSNTPLCTEVICNRVNSHEHTHNEIYNYAVQFGAIKNIRALNKTKYLITFQDGKSASACVADIRPVLGDTNIKKYFNVYSPEMASAFKDNADAGKNNINVHKSNTNSTLSGNSNVNFQQHEKRLNKNEFSLVKQMLMTQKHLLEKIEILNQSSDIKTLKKITFEIRSILLSEDNSGQKRKTVEPSKYPRVPVKKGPSINNSLFFDHFK
ncbi:hypothetical protein EHP00_292 [Ecytonucleospora hepatopenaei]|uniref:Uncharacterized protein n=1 Tax=Ecytonucleospora hepatopenaei TaxID=646526 RepID=A0A1W0E7C2_9MICR|nr:hypothetical protein EHP00_292 [Ecytonucleospora hepatopenaei]